jgi:hypothetical protein
LREITIREGEVLKRTYQVRKTGRRGKSLETTIPREVFDREARRLGLSPEDAVSKVNAVWFFDGFEGLYLFFQLKERLDGAIAQQENIAQSGGECTFLKTPKV